MRGISRRRFAAAISITVVAPLLLLTFGFYPPRRVNQAEIGLVSQHHRKLLQLDNGTALSSPSTPTSTDRVGDGCSMDDIVVHQGATTPQPNGIPTYTVVVLNLCSSSSGGCAMGNIHLSCGAFSSARLINPRVFRRLRINDCLLNDGRPLPPGSSMSFQYANSFSYPLAISSASCSR
ncbi:TPD1 protein [Canna indica]|uniref:TPD1 protein n=1 Tax=Canna indica TaxID=4628 RepID=A0AAQ3KSH7_9LILI|nr:TPD1 protein [Canna indica]